MRRPERRRDNPKARVVRPPPEGVDLDAIAEQVTYESSPYHSRVARIRRPRPDASKCPPEVSKDLERVELLLREAIIEDVLCRMRQRKLPLETLEEAWQGVRELDEEEWDFARAAALLGADPFGLDDELADAIVEFWQGIPASLRGDSLGAATGAESLPAVRRWIERSLDVLDQDDANAVATSSWEALRESVVQSNSPIPWRRGYDLAKNFRREIVGDSSRDPNALGGELKIPYRHVHAVSNRLQGLVAAGSPACVGTVSSDTSRRFLQARSVGAFLSPSGRDPSLLSSMATDFQAFTRAFAAELLAPAEQLRARIKGGRTSVTALARDFRVSPLVISHQIQNHGLGFATGG